MNVSNPSYTPTNTPQTVYGLVAANALRGNRQDGERVSLNRAQLQGRRQARAALVHDQVDAQRAGVLRGVGRALVDQHHREERLPVHHEARVFDVGARGARLVCCSSCE